jgi:hypothetical protein
VAWNEHQLQFQVTLPRSPDSDIFYSIALFPDVCGTEYLWKNPAKDPWMTQEERFISVTTTSDNFTFDAAYPWDVLPQAARECPALPVLLQVNTLHQEPGRQAFPVEPSLSIPLSIIMGKA